MNIKGFLKSSFVDWDGYIVSVIFAGGCNFRCPFCYNYKLALNPEEFENFDLDYIFDYLNENKDFVDGVCITGGEPTLQKDLPEFCEKIKSMGMKIKLDTNGSNPEIVEELISKKLVDFIAMDMKNSFENYEKAIGIKIDIEKIKKTIKIIISSGIEHEFRTTVVPSIHIKEDIIKMAEALKGCKSYILQKFAPFDMLDKNLMKQKTLSNEEMQKFADAVKDVINVKIRG
jgi:pyruvate formate lyase activating enzyme